MKLKNVLKTVGVLAALAAVVPFSHEKDEETGETKTQALLWNMTTRPGTEEEGGKRQITVNIGLPQQEICCCCCDEDLPDENLFADLADCGCTEEECEVCETENCCDCGCDCGCEETPVQ